MAQCGQNQKGFSEKEQESMFQQLRKEIWDPCAILRNLDFMDDGEPLSDINLGISMVMFVFWKLTLMVVLGIDEGK